MDGLAVLRPSELNGFLGIGKHLATFGAGSVVVAFSRHLSGIATKQPYPGSLVASQQEQGYAHVGNPNEMKKTDVWQGTLALMVLKTLEVLGPQHGYGIAKRIEQTSGNLLSINQG